MSLLQQFEQYIYRNHLFTNDQQLILAVSGGVDSVVLVDLCAKSGYSFSIAHCNFQLRKEESDADELFVQSLGKKYNVTVHVKKFDTVAFAFDQKLSIQEAARVLRYEWFEELVNSELSIVNNHSRQTGASDGGVPIHLLTAHHADDNNETLLMNFFRGTGLHGLTGIPMSYGHIKRPLLQFTKEELIAYAQENNLQWREDASNQSSKYTRNFFRNEILPQVEKVYPQVKDNLQDNINRFKEIEQLYKISTQLIIKKLCRHKGAEVHIPIKQLLQYNNRALIYEIIKEYGFAEKQIDEVLKLCNAESGKFIDSPAFYYRIIKHRHWLLIAPSADSSAQHFAIEGVGHWELGIGNIQVKTLTNSQASIPNAPNIAVLDASKIEFPLLLRRWKQGDYFYPLGMKKKKKLARFFIDQKLSKTQKENVWVLESNKKIIWVVGMRIDERFKLLPATQTILQIETGFE
ncbi:tRNA lysidine(34) synthetase TilS [Lacibacter sp. MH-610]|uniref:tRNA lysidine(34) synthetase TilS n=1 Tax=Lacibacter sp. MH-610 TaxID=3020883 RepID=UPI00389279C4